MASEYGGLKHGYERNVLTADAMPQGEVGRNDSCSCGSGKKYKKYHGAVK